MTARRDFLKHLGFVTAQPATTSKIEPVMTEEQKVQELMKPRYIVENLWFGAEFNPGDILVKMPNSNAFSAEGGIYGIVDTEIDKYPYLVRKLHWHEERDLTQMPEYLKTKSWPHKVVSVKKHFTMLTADGKTQLDDGSTFLYADRYDPYWAYEPATSADYHAYISSPELK